MVLRGHAGDVDGCLFCALLMAAGGTRRRALACHYATWRCARALERLAQALGRDGHARMPS